jgi:cell division septum initiation protein DivIVA
MSVFNTEKLNKLNRLNDGNKEYNELVDWLINEYCSLQFENNHLKQSDPYLEDKLKEAKKELKEAEQTIQKQEKMIKELLEVHSYHSETILGIVGNNQQTLKRRLKS